MEHLLKSGMILDSRYRIDRMLGEGGFGITYRAWDNSLDTLVCIKEYYPSGLVQRTPGEKEVILAVTSRKTEYETGLNRFLEEARNMVREWLHEHGKRFDWAGIIADYWMF